MQIDHHAQIEHPALRNTTLILALLFLLTACGQKGPLFLPPAEQAVEQQAQQKPDTDEQNESESDDAPNTDDAQVKADAPS